MERRKKWRGDGFLGSRGLSIVLKSFCKGFETFRRILVVHFQWASSSRELIPGKGLSNVPHLVTICHADCERVCLFPCLSVR